MNDPKPVVSIITVVYNARPLLAKTMESVREQKARYPFIEYVVVDGASKDGTLELIGQNKDIVSSWVSEPDKGIYDAMNKGIRLASGQLIGIVNSDDWYEPDTVWQAVSNYQGNPYEVIYGMQRTYLDGREKATVLYHHDFLPQQMITHPTCFVTKAAYEALGVFDTQYRSAADYDLMLRFYESRKVVFTPVMSVLSNFQLGGMSSSQKGVRENARIRYRRGYMSRKRYYFVTLKSHLFEWTHR